MKSYHNHNTPSAILQTMDQWTHPMTLQLKITQNQYYYIRPCCLGISYTNIHSLGVDCKWRQMPLQIPLQTLQLSRLWDLASFLWMPHQAHKRINLNQQLWVQWILPLVCLVSSVELTSNWMLHRQMHWMTWISPQIHLICGIAWLDNLLLWDSCMLIEYWLLEWCRHL